MDVGSLNITIKVDGKEANVNLNQFSEGIRNNTAKIARSLDSQVVKWGAVSVAMNNVMDLWRRGMQFLGSFIAESNENEIALARVKAVLVSTKYAAGLTADQLKKMSDRLEEMTGVAGATITNGAAILLTFKNIRENAFERTMKLALDLQSMFGDLRSSTVQLGKALNDPVTGLTALTRVGISFTEQEKKQIKAAMSMNDITKAQEIMFKALEGQVKAVSETVGKTGAGSMREFRQSIKDIKSIIGDFIKEDLLPLISRLRELTKALKANPAALKAVYEATKMLIGAFVFIKITTSMKALMMFFKTTLPVALEVAQTAAFSTGAAIAAIGVGLGSIIYYYNKMKDAQAEAMSREEQNAKEREEIEDGAGKAIVQIYGKSVKEIAEMDKGLDLLKQVVLARRLTYLESYEKARKKGATQEEKDEAARAKKRMQRYLDELKAVENIIKKKKEASKAEEESPEITTRLNIAGETRLEKYKIFLHKVEQETNKTSKKSIDAWNNVGKTFQSNYNDMQATLQEFTKNAMSIMDNFSNRLATELTNAMFGVQVSWKNVFQNLLYSFVQMMVQMLIKAIATTAALQALNAMTGGVLFATGGTVGQVFNAWFQPDTSFNPTGPIYNTSIQSEQGTHESIPEQDINTKQVINYNIFSPLARPNWETLDISRRASISRRDEA